MIWGYHYFGKHPSRNMRISFRSGGPSQSQDILYNSNRQKKTHFWNEHGGNGSAHCPWKSRSFIIEVFGHFLLNHVWNKGIARPFQVPKMEVRIFSSWIWPNFFAYIFHEASTPTSAYHLSIFWSIIVDAEETSSVSNRIRHHKSWPKLPIFTLVTTRTLSPHQSSQGELLQPNFLISKMLLKAIRWSPPVMYETLPKKRWDILHINWWSLDFWTINSMNIAILMDPWIMGVKFRPPHMKKWTHHVFDHMGVSENSGTSKSSHFNRVFRYKPSILGYHHFRKPPYHRANLHPSALATL